MIQALFSFSGRIGRAAFIRWSICQAIISGVLLAGIHQLSANTIADLQSGAGVTMPAIDIGIVAVLSVALVVLPSSALLIKRLRDVGLAPWPCLTVISLVDALISNIVPQSTQFAHGPFAGLAFSMLVTILLAFVPGRGSAERPEGDSAAWVERAALAEAKLLEQQRPQVRPSAVDQLQAQDGLRRNASSSSSVEPQGFGRRRAYR